MSKQLINAWNNFSLQDLNIYASCILSKQKPAVNTVDNSITIPVASDDPNCPKNFLDVVSRTKYAIHEFTFKGIFKGGNTASSATEEMAIFVGKNIITWDEHEFGFVFTNNDCVLKGYVQGKTDAGSFYKYTVLDKYPDGLTHTYRISVSMYDHDKIYFYIDNTLKGIIHTYTNLDYYNMLYHVVGTTHRNIGGWNSDDYKLILKDIKYR
jgi:hypothetical protein